MKITTLTIIPALLAAMLLAGCASHREAAARTETVYVDRWRADTIVRHDVDSVYVEAKTVRDTVYLTKEAWRTRWKEKVSVRHDTVYATRTDTVTVVQPVEAKITPWQRVCMSAGKAALVGLLMALLWALWKYRKWIARIIRKIATFA